MDLIRSEAKMDNNNLFCLGLAESQKMYYIFGRVSQKGEKLEEAITDAITDNEDIALRIFDILKNNGVYPEHFNYVIDDIWNNVNS